MTESILAVVPARGGSKGLPRKNIRPLAGHPLIWHSVACARMAPEITRCVISTDDAEIREIGLAFGADVPFLRPARLATDETPMMPVLAHALDQVEATSDLRYDAVMLLDPTSPCRIPSDITRAAELLAASPDAVGVVAVSVPRFNPLWVSVVETEHGRLRRAIDAPAYARRQDVPAVLRINGALYLWRASFVRQLPSDWLNAGSHVAMRIPESRAYSIDDIEEFESLTALIHAGMVRLPWLPELPGA